MSCTPDNQFRKREWSRTWKQTDRENSQPPDLPATLLLLRCMSLFSWNKCEVPTAPSNVRVRGQSGRHLLGMSISHFGTFETHTGAVQRCPFLGVDRKRQADGQNDAIDPSRK
jgi:hypothetical protein